MAKAPLKKDGSSLAELLVEVAAATPKDPSQLEKKLGKLTVEQANTVRIAIQAIYRSMNPGVGGPG